jgi:hypothetical protein
MPYRYAHDRPDYSDFAAGPVFYSLPGQPAFPVRLASEIFQRCQARLLRFGSAGPYTVYDPCCGSAYLVATLAYLHWPSIRHIVGSDVDPAVIPLAERNLSLLTPSGVETRMAQLARLYQEYGKPSHARALASAERLLARLHTYHRLHLIPSRAFVADALRAAEVEAHIARGSVDIVMTDLPYGQRTMWRETTPQPAGPGPAWQLLEALRGIVAPRSVIAVTTTKQDRVAHDAYERVEQFQLGKRRTLFFMLRISG